MRTIPIVMSFDRNYYFPACVATCSVMEHADPSDQYRFYFLIPEKASKIDRGVFDALAKQYPNFSYSYITVNEQQFKRAQPSLEHISLATYFRLLIPEVVREHDRCIYMDTDMIALGDVAQVFDVCDASLAPRFSDCYLAAAREMLFQIEERDWVQSALKTIGFESGREYFNAGLLVMNLSLLRSDHMVETFLSLIKRRFFFADQDILNYACKGRVLILPARFNLAYYCIGNRFYADRSCLTEEDRADTMLRRPVICHFPGPDKPWNTVEADWEIAWLEAARKLPQTGYVKEQVAICEQNQVDSFREDRLPSVRRADEVVLYGFAHAGFILCDALLGEGLANIRCFCDGDPKKAGLSHKGIPCCSPEALPGLSHDALIVICAQKPWREIAQGLIESGIDPSRILRFRGWDSKIIDID